jgi:hypothetical protein
MSSASTNETTSSRSTCEHCGITFNSMAEEEEHNTPNAVS